MTRSEGQRRGARAEPHPHASAAVLPLVVSLVLVLVGCARDSTDRRPPDMPRPERTAGVPDHSPPLGMCWHEPDYEVVSAWSWWQGSAPVDCATEHNSITAAVGELPVDFAAPWSDTGDRRDLTDEERRVVHGICTDGIGADVGLREGTRVTWFWYLPSPRQWAAGERWLRCDVAVVALGPLSPTVVEPLPADVADVVDHAWDAYAYRLCLDTPYAAPEHLPWFDPDANVAVYCDAGPQWHFGGSVTFDDAALPPHDEMVSALAPSCAELVGLLPRRTDGVIYVPNEQTWAQGSRTAVCWIY